MTQAKNNFGKLLERGVVEIVEKQSLLAKLRSGKKLRIKHGVDPTGSELTLGHAVVYFKMREFQKLGHKIVLVIGDFTARIGDPTDRSENRAMLPRQLIEENAKNYLRQVGKILDMDEVEVRHNSQWHEKTSLFKFLTIASKFSLQQLSERQMFKDRINRGQPVWIHEMVYPILQGYDSVELKADLTIIGHDQLFNEIQGRILQEAAGQPPQDILAVPILVGTDGVLKMSKSLNNYIGLEEEAKTMFAKIMSLPDQLMIDYFTLLTTLSRDEIRQIDEQLTKGKINPMEVKKRLASEIVSFFHSKNESLAAQAEFERVVQKGEVPSQIPVFRPGEKSLVLLEAVIATNLVGSKSQAKRLIAQGGVELDGQKVKDPKEKIVFADGQILKVGKRGFVKIIL